MASKMGYDDYQREGVAMHKKYPAPSAKASTAKPMPRHALRQTYVIARRHEKFCR